MGQKWAALLLFKDLVLPHFYIKTGLLWGYMMKETQFRNVHAPLEHSWL